MKTLSALILVMLCNTHKVTSFPLFEEVATKLKAFADSFMTALRTIRIKFKGFINKHFKKSSEDTSLALNQLPVVDILQKTKNAFKGILEERIPDSETEIFDIKSDPSAMLTMPQLAKHHGKKIETHVVVTGDGYLLTIHRLMKPLDQPYSTKLLNPTVLLHHGLFGSSADWILSGPNKSLPYLLSSMGYDVWMTNARGNYYSRGHVTKDVNSLDYWKFSWQEMGMYDLPAVVDYIRKLKKSNDTMDFVGHSMGATALLVMLSTIPSYNEYFRTGILLAPLAYMSNVEGPLRIFSPLAMNLPRDVLKTLGEGEFLPTKKIPPWIVTKYCKGAFFYCSNPLLFISGSVPKTDKWSSNLVANILYHVPAGGSTNTILHYVYVINTGRFQMYEKTTEFPLKKVTLPIALFSSSDDWLATVPDVLKLYFTIPNPIDHNIIRGKNFSHMDFVFGQEADTLVFVKVVDILERGVSGIKQNEV